MLVERPWLARKYSRNKTRLTRVYCLGDGCSTVRGNGPASSGRGVQLRRMIRRTFEDVVVPHLDAAFNYARWLTRNDADAEDVVQDAVVRAFGFFSSVRTDNARSWLFTIVRRT